MFAPPSNQRRQWWLDAACLLIVGDQGTHAKNSVYPPQNLYPINSMSVRQMSAIKAMSLLLV